MVALLNHVITYWHLYVHLGEIEPYGPSIIDSEKSNKHGIEHKLL